MSINPVSGQGARASRSVDSSSGTETDPETEGPDTGGPDDGTDNPLGPGMPGSVHVFEDPPPAPPPQRPAVAPATGAGETVSGGGGGPGGPYEQPPIPVTGPPKPNPPKQYPPIVSGLGKDVDRLLNKSQTMRELFAKAKDLGYKIEFRNGPNETDHDKNRIYINPNSLIDGHKLTPTELAALASHEIDHAANGPGRPILPLDREGFAKQSQRAELEQEASAALTNAKVRAEIMAAGGEDIGIRGGLDEKVIRIFEEGKNQVPPMTDQEIKAALVPVVAAEPRGRPDGTIGRTDQVFLEKYQAAYDALYNK